MDEPDSQSDRTEWDAIPIHQDQMVTIVDESERQSDRADSACSFPMPIFDIQLSNTNVLPNNEMSVMYPVSCENGKKRKRISLKTKLDILRRLESNEKVCDICRMYGLASSTICTINSQAEMIKSKAALVSSRKAKYLKQFPRKRSLAMEKMEEMLCLWIGSQINKNTPLTRSVIKEQARYIFNNLKTDGETFIASTGWYNRFKVRNNIEYNAEEDHIENKSKEPMVCDCVHLQQVIDEGGYTVNQVFTVSEMGFLWKSLPKKFSIISKDNDDINTNDHLSVLLACNAAGDMKLKPLVVYNIENPEALSGYTKTKLPVLWRSGKKAVVTRSIFEEWFKLYFCPAVEHYCTRKKIPKRALLVVDIAECHPTHLNRLSEHVRVEFLPENSTLFQPMNQGIMFKFKTNYLQKCILHLLGSNANEPLTAFQIWRKFNILNAIEYIALSWNSLDLNTINAAWRTIWPDCVSNADTTSETVSDVITNLVASIKEIGFFDIEEHDIVDWMESHDRCLQIDNISCSKSDISNGETDPPPRELTIECLEEAQMLIERGLNIFSQHDPHNERSVEVTKMVRKAIQCYKDIYSEKQKRNAQSLLNQHFCATPASSSEMHKHNYATKTKKETILSIDDCCNVKVEVEVDNSDDNQDYSINF